MEERRKGRRGPVTTLRIVAGTVAVAAPLGLGLLGHSPWKVLLLVPAFAASYALGRASAWRVRLREGSAGTVASAALATCTVQLVLAAALYLFGLGIGALLGDALPIDPLTPADLVFVGLVWAITLGSALASARMERRRAAGGPARIDP